MEFIVERSNVDGTFTVVSRHESFDDALEALKEIKSELRHEVWCKEWTNTDLGYMPMAWKN